MKKKMTRLLAFVLAVCLLSGCLTALAATPLTAASISVNSGVKILVDGKEFVPVDSEGVPVEVFLYDGTTYLPVRGISNLFGLGVDWDQDTKTVYLGSRDGVSLQPASVAAAVDASPFAFEARTLEVNTGVSICYNGEAFVPTDSEGKVVDVFLHEGTTYLPVRAISKLMDAAIDWDQSSKSVLIRLAAEEKPAGVDQAAAAKVGEEAKKVAESFTAGKSLMLEYYAFYIKANGVLQQHLKEAAELFQISPVLYGDAYTLFLASYTAFEKQFGTYITKSRTLQDFAETLIKRVDTYAADGYTAEEVELLQTNTQYLEQNQKIYTEFVKSASQAEMLQFVKDSFSPAVYAAVAAVA